MLGYGANSHLIPLTFSHFVGPKLLQTCLTALNACKRIPVWMFKIEQPLFTKRKPFILLTKTREFAKMFLDPLHVRINLGPRLGMGKSVCLSLYDIALYAPSVSEVASVKEEHSRTQRNYLAQFPDSELYRAHSYLQDCVVTFRGAASGMEAALRNHIRPGEHPRMLERVFF